MIEQVKNLTGKSASVPFLTKLTYIALNHDKRILQIDTVRYVLSNLLFFFTWYLDDSFHSISSFIFILVPYYEFVYCSPLLRAFHLGVGFLVEVDIVLPEEMTLKEAHDIGESLQIKLEQVKPTINSSIMLLSFSFSFSVSFSLLTLSYVIG